MERLETELFEAASNGSTISLQNLLKVDPLILDRVVVNCFSETPLHVAAMLGHNDFVREIIRIKPQLATELNSLQSSPLHLASAKGHVDVVRALLSVDPRTCLARDRNRLTPLHLAALKGRIEVVKMLLQEKLDATQIAVYGRENILHLCVKHYQIEVLKLLVKKIDDPELINSKDDDGNTLLHLAVAYKQVETIEFLLAMPALDVHASNLNGMTAVDVLIQSKRDIRDAEIEESLQQAGCFGTLDGNTATNMNGENNPVRHQNDWLEKMRSALMVVASLIATMAFQVGANPPSGVWQDSKIVDAQGKSVSNPHLAGLSVLAYNYPRQYVKMYIYNTVSFTASLGIVLLLTSGLPVKRRIFMWIMMVITWIAITSIAVVYLTFLLVLTPLEQAKPTFNLAGITMFAWLILVALLLIIHIVHLIVKLVKKLRKTIRRRKKRRVGA